MSNLLCDNPDVMGSLLVALCDPGHITDRAPLESLPSWQRRAVIEHAAPYIIAAERQSIRHLAAEHTDDCIADCCLRGVLDDLLDGER